MSEAIQAKASQFINAVSTLCGEADEAAGLAMELFEEPQRREVRRALARVMELMESNVLPHFREKWPNIESQ